MNRREFIRGAAACGLFAGCATTAERFVAKGGIRAYLMHLGWNMWSDRPVEKWGPYKGDEVKVVTAADHLRTDVGVWNRVDAYLELEKAGFDQVPTGSNWSCDANLRGTVDFCRRHISPSRLKGFMMAPWFFPDPRWEDKLMDACRLGREAFRA